MREAIRRDGLALLLAAGAGLAIDVGHSIAWRAFLRRAPGEQWFTVVIVLLACAPVATMFVATLRILSRALSLRRAAATFLVVGLLNLVQSVALVELLFPGMLPPVALGGRGLGMLVSILSFGVASALAWRRIRSSSGRQIRTPSESADSD